MRESLGSRPYLTRWRSRELPITPAAVAPQLSAEHPVCHQVIAVRRFAVFRPATWPGTNFDWGFSALAVLLVCAGYVDAWQIRHPPVHLWSHAASQGAWLVLTLFLVAVGSRNWLRSRSLELVVPEGYELSAVGCVVFAIGMLIGFLVADRLRSGPGCRAGRFPAAEPDPDHRCRPDRYGSAARGHRPWRAPRGADCGSVGDPSA